MLIELDHNMIANSDQIRTIEALTPVQRGQFRCSRSKVTFADGESLVVERDLSSFGALCGMLLPAAGYQMVTAQEDAGTAVFTVQPVLGLQYEGGNSSPMTPITDEGPPSDSLAWGLVRPDGSVIDWDRSYDTLDEYKADYAQRLAESAKRRAA